MTTIEQQKQQEQIQIVLRNEQKRKIIDLILKQYNLEKSGSTTLQLSISYEPMKKQLKNLTNSNLSTQETLFEYNIPGSKFKHKSKNSNLLTKIEEMEDQMREQQLIKQKQNQREGSQSPISSNEQVDQQPQNMKQDDNFRYYKDNIICYKCNKVGHYKAVCPQISTCMYCFSEQHQSENCQQKKVCYRCYDFGHVIANCKMRESKSKCYQCEKYHDDGCYFLVTKITNGQKKKSFYQPIYNDRQIQCIRCLKYGHIQCNN